MARRFIKYLCLSAFALTISQPSYAESTIRLTCTYGTSPSTQYYPDDKLNFTITYTKSDLEKSPAKIFSEIVVGREIKKNRTFIGFVSDSEIFGKDEIKGANYSRGESVKINRFTGTSEYRTWSSTAPSPGRTGIPRYDQATFSSGDTYAGTCEAMNDRKF